MAALLNKIPSTKLSQTVFAAIGLACYLRLVLRSYNFFRSDTLYSVQTATMIFAFFIVVFVATFLLLFFLRDKIDIALLEKPLVSFSFVAFCAAGCCLLRLSMALPVGNMLVLSLFVFIYASGLALALCAQAATLYLLDQRHAQLAIILAFMAYIVFNFTGLVHVRGVPGAVTLITALLMLTCWLFSYRPVRIIQPRCALSLLRKLPLAQLGTLLAAILVCGVAIGVLALDDQERVTFSDMLVVAVLAVVIGMLLLAGMRVSGGSGIGERAGLALSIVSSILVVVMLFVAIAFSLVGSDSRVPSLLISMARRFCIVCCLVILSKSMHERALSPTLLFSLFGLAGIALPLVCGRFLVPVVDSNSSEFILHYEEVVILCMSGLFICASFISLLVSQVLKIDDDAGGDAQLKLQDAYDTLARSCGLTPREREIMALIDEGNTMKKIGELLYISLGTVQTHSKNLYRKLGVHSKQELADLVREHVS